MHTYWKFPSWRIWFGEKSLELSFGQLCFALSVDESHIRIALPFFQIFSPFPGSKHCDDVDVNHERSYGFAMYQDTLHLHWGFWTRVIWWPWADWKHVRHDILSEPETHPFTYILRNGEIQQAQATIQIEEREWRLFRKWMPIKRVSRCINVKFDRKIGEKSGSWKGGVLGCGYKLRQKESGIECLRRMERERRF